MSSSFAGQQLAHLLSPPPSPQLNPAPSSAVGFRLGSAAYIIGITLLVTVALVLGVLACMLRRKDRRHRELLRATAREAETAALQRQAEEAAVAAARKPPVIPVVIVMPDGSCLLAQEIKWEVKEGLEEGMCGSSSDEGDIESGGAKGAAPTNGTHSSGSPS